MFDWMHFLQANGVEHVVGPTSNVRRGHVGFNCPRCADDAKHHYSIELDTGKIRGCWRDPSHWMPPAELIVALSGCTLHRAYELLKGQEEQGTTGATAADLLEELTASDEDESPVKKVRWRDEHHRFRFSGASKKQKRFVRYLEQRGFTLDDAVRGGLRWAADGKDRNRIIFPLYSWEEGFLAGWSGRSIGSARAKYLSYPSGEAIQHLCYESRPLSENDLLVIVEGPFDAFSVTTKLDTMPDDPGVVGCAILSNSVGPEKIKVLAAMGSLARQTVIMLDRGAETQALELARQLALVKPDVVLPIDGVKDPGDATEQQLRRALRGFL